MKLRRHIIIIMIITTELVLTFCSLILSQLDYCNTVAWSSSQ